MKQTFLPKVSEAVRVNIRHRQWQHALLAMAAVVVFITVYMLILPAITMTGPTCGLEEHTHSDGCYELRLVCGLEETPEGDAAHVHGPACYEQQQVLTCGQEEGSGHTHTDACMGYVCGQEEGAGHTHTDACYADVTVEELTCTQEESAGHTHDASCYTVEEELTCGMSEGEGGHEHDDGCCDPETGELTCGMSEGEGGHEHDEGCYTQTETLTCTQEESAGHTHDASCYTQTVERQLVCGQEETEGHVHTDACMGYTCGQEESAGHTHTEACYTTQDVLICGESEGHTHTDACYEQVLVCQIPEHTHTEECYASGEEPPVEEIPEEDVPLGEYACGKEEHAHTQDCYDADGNLICALEEHAHDESCLAEEIPEYICGKEEHAHTEDCYDAGGNLTCALEEHTHDETCLPVEQEPGAFPEELPEGYGEYEYEDADTGLSVLAYAPENAFGGKNVTLFAQVLDQDSDAYADAQANLEDAGALDENTGMAALDISFRNADGDEVEPDPAAGPVYVRLDARALIPDGVDESTVAVQHHAETTDGGLFGTGIFAGTEVEVETVADSSGDTGEVTLTPSARPLAAPLSLPAETEEAPEEEAAAALDVEAKFAVDGFSTFTITWGYGYYNSVTVHYVDQAGTEIYGDQTDSVSVQENEWVCLADYAKEISGYTYQGAHLNSGNGTAATYVKYNGNRWRYTNSDNPPSGDGSGWHNSNRTIYLVYKLDAKLTKADTITHTDKGVHMFMFNYDGPAFDKSIGGYGSEDNEGTTKEDLSSETTNNSGWPTLAENNTSFSSYFGGQSNAFFTTDNGLNNKGQSVDKLFLKENYDKNGEFYFNSAEYFATLKDEDGKVTDTFTVYNQLGTPRADDVFYFQRGNFLPYDVLDLENVANFNLYDDTGRTLTPSDERYGEPIFKTKTQEGLTPNGVDYYFGMYTWAQFYQPQDGIVEDNDGEGSSPMRFEFTGDDDMWVYIDGVLVLDIGGIHDAQTGYIDFSTGEVNWTDTPMGYDDNDHKVPNENVIWYNGGERSTQDNPIYLDDIFVQAGAYDQAANWDGHTFADGSYHTIQIFYMERGDGASNLKMSFNLKTIPDGQLLVRKDVENYYAPQLKDVEYTMQVTVNGKAYANQPYTLFEQEGGGKTNSEGKFKLKYGQTAVFEDLTVGDQVKVEEVGVSQTPDGSAVEQAYDISYTVTDSSGQIVDGGNASKKPVSATMPGYGSITVAVTNRATFTRPLKLVKTFEGTENNQPPEGFEATYTLYDVTGGSKTEVGSIRYSDMVNGQYVFWLETGKTYAVEETFDGQGDEDGGTEALYYLGNTVTDTQKTTPEGQVELTTNSTTDEGDADTITVTNRYGEPSADLTIIKNIYGLEEDQVAKLLEEGYRPDGGLRFDVDYFASSVDLIQDENGVEHEKPDGSTSTNWNKGDWSFDVCDTVKYENGAWTQDIVVSGGDSISEQEKDHYGQVSVEEKRDASGETYYQYKVTISDIDISQYDLFRVWEMHMDVDGYVLDSEVEEYFTGQGPDSLGNLLTTEEYMGQTGDRGDHGGRATAFELTGDTTVEFTNRYSQGQLDLTKNVTVSGQTNNTGDDLFTFTIQIPDEWATGYNSGEYSVTYERDSQLGDQHENGTITFSASDTDPSDGLATAEIQLYAGETAHIKLPTGIDVIVTEPNHDGYSVNWNVSGSDILNQESENSVRFTLSDEKAVTCTNTTGAVLPSTGGPGVANILTLGTLLTLGAGALLLLQRRRKEGDAC